VLDSFDTVCGWSQWRVLLEHHADQIATVLTNLGEKMSDEEVDELLKAVDTTSGEINYTGMMQNVRRYRPQTDSSGTDLVRMILNN